MKQIKELLEQTFYDHYLKENPEMVSGIKKLLIAGESKSKIKKWCKALIGECQTSRTIGNMIDCVDKQIKN